MSWEPYEKPAYTPKEYVPYSGPYPRYYAKTWYSQEGEVYESNPRYKKLFKLAMSRGGFKFAQWYLVEIFERSQLAYYNVDDALDDWYAAGTPVADPMPTYGK